MYGLVQINGSAPAGSDITIRNEHDGEIIARCKAGADGRYLVKSARLPVGDHHVRAVSVSQHGVVSESPLLNVYVYEPEPEAAFTAAEVSAEYTELVENFANGFDVDADEALQIIQAQGKTVEQFGNDVKRFLEPTEE